MAKTFYEKGDDYKDTVFALIGFANFFRFDSDTRTMNENVKVAQGRRMQTSNLNKVSPGNVVTPDLIIQLDETKGVAAEVKISFPRNNDHWEDDFKQLLKYDDDLEGWWTENKKITNHDIVLLPHQSRAAAVEEYFREKTESGEITFERPFAIVEFNRSDQRNVYYFFRKMYGEITVSAELSNQLKYGIEVPLDILLSHYERHKIYDTKPPMPYFLLILWENVILRWASDKPEFERVRKNSKLTIGTNINAITKELYEYCSFKGFNFTEEEHQPKMPLKIWVIDAINSLVKFNFAKWLNQSEGTCEIYFKKYDEVYKLFVDKCMEYSIDVEDLEGSEYQAKLFRES